MESTRLRVSTRNMVSVAVRILELSAKEAAAAALRAPLVLVSEDA